jgi:hypothetical protein
LTDPSGFFGLIPREFFILGQFRHGQGKHYRKRTRQDDHRENPGLWFRSYCPKDHAYGWYPNVVAAPDDMIGHQRRAEEIACLLRVQFDLRD